MVKRQIEMNKCIILDERDNFGRFDSFVLFKFWLFIIYFLSTIYIYKIRPIGLIKVKNHDPKDKDIDKYMAYIVWIYEQGCKCCNDDEVDNFCAIIDLDGFSRSYFELKTIQAIIKFRKVGHENYPERLGVCLFINAPPMFKRFWSFIKPW